MLLKLESAWEVALELDRRQFWLALSGKAMEMMNVELAMRVYRQLGDAGMVMALQVIEKIMSDLVTLSCFHFRFVIVLSTTGVCIHRG